MGKKHPNHKFIDETFHWKTFHQIQVKFSRCDFLDNNEKVMIGELNDYLKMRTQEEKEKDIINYHIHPSIQTLADNLGMEHGSTEDIIKKMVDKGVLQEIPMDERPKSAKGRVKYYYFVFHPVFDNAFDFKYMLIENRDKHQLNSEEWKTALKWVRAFSKAAKKMKDIYEFDSMVDIFKEEYKVGIALTPKIEELESKGFGNKKPTKKKKKKEKVVGIVADESSNVVEGDFTQPKKSAEEINNNIGEMLNEMYKVKEEVKEEVAAVKVEVKQEPVRSVDPNNMPGFDDDEEETLDWYRGTRESGASEAVKKVARGNQDEDKFISNTFSW